jgi:hypothetical protein
MPQATRLQGKFHPALPLLVDTNKKIAQLFEVQGDTYAARDTIVIDKEGKSKILRRWIEGTFGELLNLLGTTSVGAQVPHSIYEIPPRLL